MGPRHPHLRLPVLNSAAMIVTHCKLCVCLCMIVCVHVRLSSLSMFAMNGVCVRGEGGKWVVDHSL